MKHSSKNQNLVLHCSTSGKTAHDSGHVGQWKRLNMSCSCNGKSEQVRSELRLAISLDLPGIGGPFIADSGIGSGIGTPGASGVNSLVIAFSWPASWKPPCPPKIGCPSNAPWPPINPFSCPSKPPWPSNPPSRP